MAVLHKLPTNAQTSADGEMIDHVRLEREIREPGTMYHRQVTYGTMKDGEFVPNPLMEKGQKLVLPDIAAFDEERSVNDSAPDLRGTAASQFDADVAAHADENDLWHTIQS